MNILGHGVDIVEIARIQHMLDAHGAHFTDRCFTAAEQRYAEAGRATRAQRYAARFAGKEAILKALGTGLTQGTNWVDMEILSESSGKPTVVLHGRCAELAARAGMTHWHVSLSHTQFLAMASVIASGKGDLAAT